MARKKKEHVLFDRMERVRPTINFNALNRKSKTRPPSKESLILKKITQ